MIKENFKTWLNIDIENLLKYSRKTKWMGSGEFAWVILGRYKQQIPALRKTFVLYQPWLRSNADSVLVLYIGEATQLEVKFTRGGEYKFRIIPTK
ncbi:hypothetical protein SJ_136 [Proteus phage SJ_PmiM]|nr:hypothetical protein SJ_136 [Proteus phage SJ_PmiM]